VSYGYWSYESSARHEAGHAVAALILQIPILEVEVGPDRSHITVARYWEDASECRDRMLMTIAGPIMADQALPDWPLDFGTEEGDERQMAVYADRLNLDAAGYRDLVLDAYRLTTSPKFERLFEATTGMLERRPRLDSRTVYAMKLLVGEQHAPRH
jgi:hypothetical protein